MGEHWSAAEEAQLRELGPAAFADQSDRSWNAVRFKYKRLMKAGRATVTTHAPTREADWETLFDALERAEEARDALSPTDESTEVRIDDGKPFAIAFVSDIHAGASGVDYAQLRRDLDTIRDTEGLYFLSNGDQWENAKPQMKSGNALYHAAFTSPREQYHYIKTRFAPVKDKMLCLVQGNHDARDGMVAGIDRLPQLAQELEVPYFSERGGTLYVKTRETQYVLVVKHQYMGNSKITATNSARRLWGEWPHSWESADVIALAHFHDPHVYQHVQRGREVVWLRSGSYKVRDEWSESKGFAPRYGVPVVVFSATGHKMTSFLDFADGVRYLNAVRA